MEAIPVANVIQGFSTTNRWLLYASLMFSPAQALSGMNSNSPTGVGFLAYNVYQQYTWYIAARDKQLHALSMLPVYLNMAYSLTYLFGVPSGNVVFGALQGLGTAALVIMNNITAWTSWKTNMPEGYGVYRFYFFGWRTLSKGWRSFFVGWQISDTIESVIAVIAALALGFVLPWKPLSKKTWDDFVVWRDTALIWGSLAVLVLVWPLILWTELIVKENNIVSETDMISVYLFIAQIVALVGPRIAELLWEGVVSYVGCSRWSFKKQENEDSVLPTTADLHVEKPGEPSDGNRESKEGLKGGDSDTKEVDVAVHPRAEKV